ncbi:MAG: hypothetical protein JO191_08020 [Mycobacteriaceae bacterium]|nr:hypothetical protein [Mycobacteriaceae bacterium]
MRTRLINVQPRPDVFAAVMATGVVSVSAEDHRYRWISDALAVVAVLALVVMVALVLNEIRREGFPYPLSDVDVIVRLFTFVAACAVIGARFQAHTAAIWAMAVIAWLAWLLLAPLSIRGMWPQGWTGLRDQARGVWELGSVATSALAIVTAHLAVLGRDRALLVIGLAMWLVAIAAYGVITWLVLWRAAATFAMMVETRWRPFQMVSLVFFWIAFAAWLLVAFATLRRAVSGQR